MEIARENTASSLLLTLQGKKRLRVNAHCGLDLITDPLPICPICSSDNVTM